MLFYFSGVGNSAWLARTLSEKLQEECLAIPDEMKGEGRYVLKESEAVGFVFPVYSWAPPQIVLDFVQKLSFSQTPSFVYMACTCGDDTGKTADIFRKAVAAKGWNLHASYSVIMPNTYVALPAFDVDPEEVVQRKLRDAASAVGPLAQRILSREEGDYCHEGILPSLKSYAIHPLFKRFLTSPKFFRATDACISCKKCEQTCPVHNITVQESPVWGDTCTLCMACYHICPVHAIHYGAFTRYKGQYRPGFRKAER